MGDELNREKRELLLMLLQQGTVMVHLDARREGVLVPGRFLSDPHLRLNLDYSFHVPDFEIKDDRVVASLSFSQKPYYCELPFEAIWGMTSAKSGQTVIFPPSLPQEVLELLTQAASAKEGEAKPAALSLVGEPQPEPPAPEAPEKPSPDEPNPPRRGHLRLIK
jgi:stringent starvation protein B